LAKLNCYVYYNDGKLTFTRSGVNESVRLGVEEELSFTADEVKNKSELILDKINRLEQDYTLLFVPKKKFRSYDNLIDLVKTEEVFW